MGNSETNPLVKDIHHYAPDLTPYTHNADPHQLEISYPLTWTHFNSTSMLQFQSIAQTQQDFQIQLQYFLKRHNHHFLVATKHFKYHDQFLASNHVYAIDIFFERIIANLAQFKEIPFFDSLHFYHQTLKGFQILAQNFGNFVVEESMIFINEQCEVKVWSNPAIFENRMNLRSTTNQPLMVRNILELIHRNIDEKSEGYVNVFEKLINSKISTFNEAINQFSAICKRYDWVISDHIKSLRSFSKQELWSLFKQNQNIAQKNSHSKESEHFALNMKRPVSSSISSSPKVNQIINQIRAPSSISNQYHEGNSRVSCISQQRSASNRRFIEVCSSSEKDKLKIVAVNHQGENRKSIDKGIALINKTKQPLKLQSKIHVSIAGESRKSIEKANVIIRSNSVAINLKNNLREEIKPKNLPRSSSSSKINIPPSQKYQVVASSPLRIENRNYLSSNTPLLINNLPQNHLNSPFIQINIKSQENDRRFSTPYDNKQIGNKYSYASNKIHEPVIYVNPASNNFMRNNQMYNQTKENKLKKVSFTSQNITSNEIWQHNNAKNCSFIENLSSPVKSMIIHPEQQETYQNNLYGDCAPSGIQKSYKIYCHPPAHTQQKTSIDQDSLSLSKSNHQSQYATLQQKNNFEIKLNQVQQYHVPTIRIIEPLSKRDFLFTDPGLYSYITSKRNLSSFSFQEHQIIHQFDQEQKHLIKEQEQKFSQEAQKQSPLNIKKEPLEYKVVESKYTSFYDNEHPKVSNQVEIVSSLNCIPNHMQNLVLPAPKRHPNQEEFQPHERIENSFKRNSQKYKYSFSKPCGNAANVPQHRYNTSQKQNGERVTSNGIQKNKTYQPQPQSLEQYFPSITDISIEDKSDNTSFVPFQKYDCKNNSQINGVYRYEQQTPLNKYEYEPQVDQRIMADLINMRKNKAMK